MADRTIGGFFLNDFNPNADSKFVNGVLSSARKKFGRDKVLLSDAAITLYSQDEQDQQLETYSPDYVVLLLRLTFPEDHYKVVRADREKLLSLARQILNELDPSNSQ